jgi:PAS domain S-box-containing protein
MLEGVAYCQILFDEAGQPADWIYLEVNPAFEALTGLRDAAGKRVSELIPGVRETNPELFEIYGRIAQTGVPEQFETYLPAFERWFSVKVFRPQEGHFAAVFENVTERKAANEALRTSEQSHRVILDGLAEGVVVQDAEGRIVTSNPAARAILGLNVDELTGKTSFDPEWQSVWSDGTPARGEDHPATIARITGRPVPEVIMGVRHPSGITKWLRVDATPLREGSGDDATGVVITFSDVTEPLRVEAALRDSARLLNDTQELTKVGGWAYDVPSGTVSWTDEVYRIHEVTRDEYNPGGAAQDIEFYAPEYRATIDHAFRAAVEEGRPYDLELPLVTAKGREIWVRTAGQPQFQDGRVVRVYGHIQDITERKQEEAERDRLAAVVDQSSDGIVITDPDFRLVYANAAYASSVGRVQSDLVGRGAVEVAGIGLDETVLTDMVRTVSAGRRWLREIDHRNPDGTVRHSEADIRPMYQANGAIESWVGILRDVTEREEAHAELAASEARLRTAMDAMVDGVVVTSAVRDEGGRIVDFQIDHANPAISGMGRVASSEQIGHTLLELFPAHRTNGLFDAYVRVTETGVPFAAPDFRYVDPDAAHGPIDQILDQRAAKMGDGYVLSVRDVTERERARSERDRLATVVEQSADGIVITAPDGHILYTNSAFAAELGQGPDDLTGQVLPLIMADRLGARVVADIDRTIKAGRPWFSEVAMGLPDGASRQMEISVTPRLDTDGAVSSYVTVFRDVTELRKAEADRSRLASAVEHAADLVIVSDTNGIIEYVNPAFERMTDNSAAEVLGRSKASVLRSHVHSPEFYAGLDGSVRRGEPWEGMITIHRRDGSLFEYEAALSPIRDGNGAVVGTVEIGRDVTRERAIEAAWERQTRERALVAGALADLQAAPTPAATAEAICRQVVSLAGLVTATLLYFSLDGPAMPLAFVRADGVPVPLRAVPARRSERLRERAEGGPWVEAWVHRPWHPYNVLFRDLGVQANAFAPVRHSGVLVGLLIITSAKEDATSQLAEFLPALIEFATVSGALLGPDLIDLTETGSVRHRMVKTIGEGLFHPVFQPIVDLESREVVGYEALTRFDSGQSPDRCFADAWTVEMGPALELATLGAAVAAARQLPAGRWLSLNISPRLLADTERLNAVLWPSDRPIVLEITEHEIIEDYTAIQAAIRALGHNVRLAVDDAGAGIANFGHIIELRPNLVKLDISLVRDVNTDLGRQAMVVGMRHFAAEAGCRLLAEGIETAAEADTLLALGVDLGQGFLFGHPERAEAWSAADTSRKPRGRTEERTR